MGQQEPGLPPTGLQNSHLLVQERDGVTHGKSPVSPWEGRAGVSGLSCERAGQVPAHTGMCSSLYSSRPSSSKFGSASSESNWGEAETGL